ncbi:MAG: ROK family protein [Spirochaetota bacterium]
MISDISSIHDGTRYRIKDKEKALVFQEIFTNAPVSCKAISQKLKLRPTTVSLAAQELIDDKLVQVDTIKRPVKPGRPEVLLKPEYNHYVAVTLYVEAREVKGALVNLGEEVLYKAQIYLGAETTNGRFLAGCKNLIREITAHSPTNAEVLGIGVSLIGTVDSMKKIWISTARWRKIRNLDFHALERALNYSVVLRRIQDTELEYLIEKKKDYKKMNVMLFHWGFGIGAAYAQSGVVLGSAIGRFCEIGHTRISLKSKKMCQCGTYGCLETEAAMWALIPKMKKYLKNIPIDEIEFSHVLAEKEIAELPVVVNALNYVKQGIVNLHQLFYPDTIFFIGPFTENKKIFQELVKHLKSSMPDYARRKVKVEVIETGFTGGMFAAVYPFFKTKLRELLTIRSF